MIAIKSNWRKKEEEAIVVIIFFVSAIQILPIFSLRRSVPQDNRTGESRGIRFPSPAFSPRIRSMRLPALLSWFLSFEIWSYRRRFLLNPTVVDPVSSDVQSFSFGCIRVSYAFLSFGFWFLVFGLPVIWSLVPLFSVLCGWFELNP